MIIQKDDFIKELILHGKYNETLLYANRTTYGTMDIITVLSQR